MRKTTLTLTIMVVSIMLASAIPKLIPPVYSAPQKIDMFQIDINHSPSLSFWGVPSDSVAGSAGWNIRAGIAHLLDKQRFVADRLPISYTIGSFVTMIENPIPDDDGGSFYGWRYDWNVGHLERPEEIHTPTISIYNLAPDPGGFAAAGSLDFCAAADHFLAAGIGNGTGTGCVLTGVPTTLSPIVFLIRSDDPNRYSLGNGLLNAIDQLMGGPFVQPIYGTGGTLGPILDQSPPNDWNLYTSGFQFVDSGKPKFICTLYEPGSRDYVFYNNPTFTADVGGSNCSPFTHAGVDAAQVVFGKTIGSIPVWSKL